jgi:hypothetical protein
MKPTDSKFKQWIKGTIRHPFYQPSIDKYDEMLVHYIGKYPAKLIEERRPSESETVQKYRKKVYECKTLGFFGKVLSSLQKIRKAHDYNIKFKKIEGGKIKEDETLEYYITKKFPKFYSFDNWFWSVCFGSYCSDSNAVSVIFIMNPERQENEYAKPFPIIFNSDQILDYKNDEYYFLKSTEISYFSVNNRTYEGEVYYYIDNEYYYKYEQVSNKGEFSITELPHNLGYLPVVKLHGVIEKDIMGQTLTRSRLSPLIPEFNEAVREYSDLQAGVIQSMFPTYWYYSSIKCSTCNGVGSIPNKSGAPVKCKTCSGKGDFPFNPFEHISMAVKQTSVGENPAPTPPGGIIEKDTNIITIQDKRVQDHIYNGLAALNMEHLALVPLSTSGTSKEWDRQEANNFVYSVAEDVVRILDEHIEVFNDLRFSVIIPDKNKRDDMLPEINTPYKFDLTSDQQIAEDIGKLRLNKFNQSIITAAEVEYVNRKFVTDPELRDIVNAMHELDPLSGKSEEDIILGFSNGVISKISYIIHANIKGLIETAKEENNNFMSLKLNERKEIIESLAENILNQMSSRGQVMDMISPPDELESENNIDSDSAQAADNLGKLPLAIQQLALAATRAEDSGNIKLKNQIEEKIKELLTTI